MNPMMRILFLAGVGAGLLMAVGPAHGKAPPQVISDAGTKAIQDAIDQSPGPAPAPAPDPPPEIPGSTESQCLTGIQSYSQAAEEEAAKARTLKDQLDATPESDPNHQKLQEQLNAAQGSAEYNKGKLEYWQSELDKIDASGEWGARNGYTVPGTWTGTRDRMIRNGVNPFTGKPLSETPLTRPGSGSDSGPQGSMMVPPLQEAKPDDEATTTGGVPPTGGKNTLDGYTGGQGSGNSATDLDLNDVGNEVEDASTSGDGMSGDAEVVQQTAEDDAQGQKVKDAGNTANTQKEQGLGNQFVDDGGRALVEGGKGFGTGFGQGMASNLMNNTPPEDITPTNKPTPPGNTGGGHDGHDDGHDHGGGDGGTDDGGSGGDGGDDDGCC